MRTRFAFLNPRPAKGERVRRGTACAAGATFGLTRPARKPRVPDPSRAQTPTERVEAGIQPQPPPVPISDFGPGSSDGLCPGGSPGCPPPFPKPHGGGGRGRLGCQGHTPSPHFPVGKAGPWRRPGAPGFTNPSVRGLLAPSPPPAFQPLSRPVSPCWEPASEPGVCSLILSLGPAPCGRSLPHPVRCRSSAVIIIFKSITFLF